METINKIPAFLRWILIFPTLVVVYFIVNIVLSWSIGRFIGPRDASLVNEVIYILQSDVLALTAAFCASCMMAPKGRIILSSIYCALALITLGVNIALFSRVATEPAIIEILGLLGIPLSSGITMYVFIKEWRTNNIRAFIEEIDV